jgi:hypothetical protein
MLGSLIDKNMISEQKYQDDKLVLIFPAGFNNKNEPLDYHADILMPACAKSAGGGGYQLCTRFLGQFQIKKIRPLKKNNNLAGLPKLTHVFCLYFILPAFIR